MLESVVYFDSVVYCFLYTILIDNALQQGNSLNDIQGIIDNTVQELSLDPVVAQHLSQYAMKANSMYNTYQSAELPAPPPPKTLWGDIGAAENYIKSIPGKAMSGLGGIKSYLGG